MDRRRFVPSPEGLEGRMMLSVAGAATAKAAATTTAVTTTTAADTNTSSTLQQKEQRIEHLPYYLGTLEPGRVLPQATMTQLQLDLNTILGRLTPPPSQVLDAFNLGLRDVLPNASISTEDARQLSQLFGNVLDAAGAPSTSVASLQADMNALIQADSNGPNPVMVATNDYALVLQTALAVGRPVQAPAVPKLLKADHAKGLAANVTTNHQPTLTGSYEQGFNIQIVDASTDLVLGTAPVASDGTYAVPFRNTLADGTYKIRVVATNTQGLISSPSKIYALRVVTRPNRP